MINDGKYNDVTFCVLAVIYAGGQLPPFTQHQTKPQGRRIPDTVWLAWVTRCLINFKLSLYFSGLTALRSTKSKDRASSIHYLKIVHQQICNQLGESPKFGQLFSIAAQPKATPVDFWEDPETLHLIQTIWERWRRFVKLWQTDPHNPEVRSRELAPFLNHYAGWDDNYYQNYLTIPKYRALYNKEKNRCITAYVVPRYPINCHLWLSPYDLVVGAQTSDAVFPRVFDVALKETQA